ncbi:endonuclease NucS domain-containing protein [Aureimonas sp. ME7]|uniref:endonuclease NucS domain-containing protein n=1 Tax=Aureimonas sp. ME7 TaxID=2744252 RepID=UPI0015F6CF83|nr:endonuclease NucS domain-containing protein [Aureimonas sp. ME7]
MRHDYVQWLEDKQYALPTRGNQLHRVRKVEEAYGDIERHLSEGTFETVLSTLQYSTADERRARPNPSKMKFEGNIRNNLQSYKNAIVLYRSFLLETRDGKLPVGDGESLQDSHSTTTDELDKRRLSLERDMQVALRRNIAALEPSLRIVDDGVERSVASGFIDITCEDGSNRLVVVELKAGKADGRAIGQILGYMGDLAEEEGSEIRGILVAHDFDKRTIAAARVVPTLALVRYSIEFRFEMES